ncbi:MAG: tripartite tricarboxylate transporter permease [Firmicutes bacterium]|nr:tripartite tricarboxylate transporter permease [Bacillota bacterium]
MTEALTTAQTLSLMGAGFVNALTPMNLLAMAASVTLGIVIGCLPGLSAAMGVALLLPMTFTMEPATGLIVLGGIYCGAIFGGSISAILIHTPGTPASAATALDGYQMTLQGKAGKALATACISSFFGGLLSCISLYFFAPALAKLAMKFASPENFWLSIFGLTIIAGVSSKSLLKGLMSGALGLILSTIGMDPMEGVKRFQFGQVALYDGINTTCALIGLFSMSQVLILAEKKIKERGNVVAVKDRMMLTWAEFKLITPTILRSWIIGNIIGILPGAGASIACFMGYNEAYRFSKHKEDFGHGSIEGVAGSEAANNAVTGGSLIPMLTLGIPGESVTAVLMGGLIIQGLQPGPELFTRYAPMTYTFFAGFVLIQFFMLAIGLIGSKGFAHISRLSDAILIPCVTVLCVVGSFAIRKNFVDVVLMLIFGMLGYLVRKFDLNPAAIVLALILGPIGERGLRRSLLLSGGNPAILFSTPLCWVLIILSVIGIMSPMLMNRLEKKSVVPESPQGDVDNRTEAEVSE